MRKFSVLSLLFVFLVAVFAGVVFAGDCCKGAKFSYSHNFPIDGTPATSNTPKFEIDAYPYPGSGDDCCEDVGWQFNFDAQQVFAEGTTFEFRAEYTLDCGGIPATGYIYCGGQGFEFTYSELGGDGPGNWGSGMTVPFGFDCGCELTFTFQVRMNGGSWQTFTNGGNDLSMTIECPEF